MKKYTSPAVTNASSGLLNTIIAASSSRTLLGDPPHKPFPPFQPPTILETVITSAAKSLFNALFGEDFTGLQVDSLTPCLEA